MKDFLLWIILYFGYLFVSAILGNVLWNFTKIDWINDAIRTFLPFVLLTLTYIILKINKKNTKGESEGLVKISENKWISNSLKIIVLIFGAFIVGIFLVMIFVHLMMIK